MLKHPSQWTREDYGAILYFGFHPGGKHPELPDVVKRGAIEGSHDSSKQELIKQGAEVIRETFDQCIRQTASDVKHVVPLSGGLDSRTILAALLEHEKVNKSDIVTLSFGTPRTWDFELGQRVAAAAGVENVVIDLTTSDISWTVEDLENAAAWAGDPVPILEARVNMIADERFPRDDTVIWSGYLGDPSVGSHQPTEPCVDWEDAVAYFIDHNEIASQHCHTVKFEPRTLLPSKPLIDRRRLSYEEQLDFAVRQRRYIKPVVSPNNERYITPFTHETWLSFWLNIPRNQRQDRRLFKKVVSERFSKLFSLPTSTNYGLPITEHPLLGKINGGIQIGVRLLGSKIYQKSFTHPNINYTKFDDLMRDADSLAPETETLLNSLDAREVIDIDIESLWQQHQSGLDCSDLFHQLLSIESYIRASE